MLVLMVSFSTLSNIIRLFLLLILFIALLFGAHFFTKWYAKSGIVHAKTPNIEILESQQLAPGKTILIAKIGSKYVSFLVLKDHATFLTELEESDLVFEEKKEMEPISFKDILKKMSKKSEKDS